MTKQKKSLPKKTPSLNLPNEAFSKIRRLRKHSHPFIEPLLETPLANPKYREERAKKSDWFWLVYEQHINSTPQKE